MKRYKIFVQVFLLCLFCAPVMGMELLSRNPTTEALIAEALNVLRGNGSRSVNAVLLKVQKKINGEGKHGKTYKRTAFKPVYEALKTALERHQQGQLPAAAAVPAMPAKFDDDSPAALLSALQALIRETNAGSAAAPQGRLLVSGAVVEPSSSDAAEVVAPINPKTGQLILSTVAITVAVLLLLEWALRRENSLIASWFRPVAEERQEAVNQPELPPYEEALAIATALLMEE